MSLPGATVTATARERSGGVWWQEDRHGTEGLCCSSPAKVDMSKEMGAAFPNEWSMETTPAQGPQSAHPEER